MLDANRRVQKRTNEWTNERTLDIVPNKTESIPSQNFPFQIIRIFVRYESVGGEGGWKICTSYRNACKRVTFMPKIKWNANKILYNDEVFELVWWTELKWPSWNG